MNDCKTCGGFFSCGGDTSECLHSEGADAVAAAHFQSPSELPTASAVPGGSPTLALCQDCGSVFWTTHERIDEADERNGNGNRLCPSCAGDLCACPGCVAEAGAYLLTDPEAEAPELAQ